MNKKGFTLLELLVVVLIIGILAAIALPQYRKVKIKAETREAILSVKALAEAQQRFYLTNNRYADTFNELDIDFSGYPDHNCPSIGPYFAVSDCYSNKKFTLFISSNYNSFVLYNTGSYYMQGFYRYNKQTKCYYRTSNTNNLCEEIFNCTSSSPTSGGTYYTCPNL